MFFFFAFSRFLYQCLQKKINYFWLAFSFLSKEEDDEKEANEKKKHAKTSSKWLENRIAAFIGKTI